MNYKGPGEYAHYKGDHYQVICVGRVEATLESVVIYHSLRRGMTQEPEWWVRPLEDFNAQVEVDDAPEAGATTVPRFAKVI